MHFASDRTHPIPCEPQKPKRPQGQIITSKMRVAPVAITPATASFTATRPRSSVQVSTVALPPMTLAAKSYKSYRSDTQIQMSKEGNIGAHLVQSIRIDKKPVCTMSERDILLYAQVSGKALQRRAFCLPSAQHRRLL